MPPETEWQLWRQLRGAFRINRFHMTPVVEGFKYGGVFQYETLEEALEAAEGDRVFLEPAGVNPVGDIPQGDIVLVTGNTEWDNKSYAKPEETYRINTPSKTVLYGSDAAAIALAIRYGQ
ncbi:MAG: hypothetical protein ACR2QI_06840 [Woeseiaceae bacterium]